VPRDFSLADREIADQIGVEPRQIERWRQEGCLRPPTRIHVHGVSGSASHHPGDALVQARAVRDLLAGQPALFPGPKSSFHEVRIRLFWQRRYVETRHLRRSYLALLDALPQSGKGVEDLALFAALLADRTGRRPGARAWINAIKLANTFGRADASAAVQVRSALAVLLTAMVGSTPEDERVVDAVDNLGFDLDDTLSAADLAFLDLAKVRAVVAEADQLEIDAARDTLQAMLGYIRTLSYVAGRTDKSLRWPALTLVAKRVVDGNVVLPGAMVPFVIAVRRHYLAAAPDWDAQFRRHVGRAEALAELLRALPKSMHRFIPRGGAAPVTLRGPHRHAAAAVLAWAQLHPQKWALITGAADGDLNPCEAIAVPHPAADGR